MRVHITYIICFTIGVIVSVIAMILLWIIYGFGISFGSIFVYQGVLIGVAMRAKGHSEWTRGCLLATGFFIGPLLTALLCLICMDYFLKIRLAEFRSAMGLNSDWLLKVSLIEYSVAFTANLLYLLFLSLTARQQARAPSRNNVLFSQISDVPRPLQRNWIENRGYNQNNDINDGDDVMAIQFVLLNGQYLQILSRSMNFHRLIIEGSDIHPHPNASHEDIEQIHSELRLVPRDNTLNTTVQSRDAQTRDQGNECAICFEEFDKNNCIQENRIITLSCNHTFHSICIRNSIKYMGNKCPYCKQHIPFKIAKLSVQQQRISQQ